MAQSSYGIIFQRIGYHWYCIKSLTVICRCGAGKPWYSLHQQLTLASLMWCWLFRHAACKSGASYVDFNEFLVGHTGSGSSNSLQQNLRRWCNKVWKEFVAAMENTVCYGFQEYWPAPGESCRQWAEQDQDSGQVATGINTIGQCCPSTPHLGCHTWSYGM
jgi:hypothetical protein